MRTSNDAKKLVQEFVTAANDSELVKANQKFQEDQLKTMQEIKDAINELRGKMDGTPKPSSSAQPAAPASTGIEPNVSTDIYNLVNDKEEKKGQKKSVS